MMTPAGFEHGRIASTLSLLVGRFVSDHKLGVTTAAETGFLITRNPDTVRAPDLAFVRTERLGDAPESGFFPGAPDLAVEVLSPDDSAVDALGKVHDWLASGTPQVWVVDPKRRTISTYRGGVGEGAVRVYREHEVLIAGEFLSGFTLRVAEVFS